MSEEMKPEDAPPLNADKDDNSQDKQMKRRSFAKVSGATLLGQAGSKHINKNGRKKSVEQPKKPNTPTPKPKKESHVIQPTEIHETKSMTVVPEEWTRPFKSGWKREIVYRGVQNPAKQSKQCDIYYFTPDNIKLRSLPMITDHLVKIGSELTKECFSFSKQRIYSEPQESIRNAGDKTIVSKKTNETPEVKPQKKKVKISKQVKEKQTKKKSKKIDLEIKNSGDDNDLKEDIDKLISESLPAAENVINESVHEEILSSDNNNKRKFESDDDSDQPPLKKMSPCEDTLDDSKHVDPVVMIFTDNVESTADMDSSKEDLNHEEECKSNKEAFSHSETDLSNKEAFSHSETDLSKDEEMLNDAENEIPVKESVEQMDTCECVEERSAEDIITDEKENIPDVQHERSTVLDTSRVLREMSPMQDSCLAESVAEAIACDKKPSDILSDVCDSHDDLSNSNNCDVEPKYDLKPATILCSICMHDVNLENSENDLSSIKETVCEACMSFSKKNESVENSKCDHENEISSDNSDESLSSANNEKSLTSLHSFVVDANITKHIDITRQFDLIVENHRRLIEPGSTSINHLGLNIRLKVPLPEEFMARCASTLEIRLEKGERQRLLITFPEK